GPGPGDHPGHGPGPDPAGRGPEPAAAPRRARRAGGPAGRRGRGDRPAEGCGGGPGGPGRRPAQATWPGRLTRPPEPGHTPMSQPPTRMDEPTWLASADPLALLEHRLGVHSPDSTVPDTRQTRL